MGGRFKPLLPFGDRTIVETCIGNLQHAGITEIIVVIGHRADEMRRQLGHSSVRFAVNEKVESEMSDSIRCGICEISKDAGAVLIALCDQPAVPASAIREIVRAWQVERSTLVVPRWKEQTGHPVLIDLNSWRNELLHLDPQKGLRALFDTYRDRVRRISVTSPYVTRDIDTWLDYWALYEEIFGCPPPVDEMCADEG